MNLRTDQVALTRRLIIEAFVELSSLPGARPVTVAEVARHSGVSPATIYRHFANRDELVTAAAHDQDSLGVDPSKTDWTAADLRTHLLALWERLASNMAVSREASVSEAGREMRATRWRRSRYELREFVRNGGVDPDSEEGRRLVAAMGVMVSSLALLDLHDRQGLSVEESVATAMWAFETLVRSLGIPDDTAFVDMDTTWPEGGTLSDDI